MDKVKVNEFFEANNLQIGDYIVVILKENKKKVCGCLYRNTVYSIPNAEEYPTKRLIKGQPEQILIIPETTGLVTGIELTLIDSLEIK